MQPLPIMDDVELKERGVRLPEEDRSFGSLSTEKGHLPLKAMDIQAKVVGLLSHVTLEQTFVNTLSEPLEATYIFPLPDRAAVTRFRFQVNDRIIEGDLKERGQARQEYDEAIEAGHRAAITEEERPGVFTMRVGNLMPGETARITMTMTGPLPYSEGEVTFQFPLVVAPRYIPGTPLDDESVGDGVAPDTDAVPDASRITPPVLLPGYPNPVQLALSVDVDPAGMPMSDLRSSLHTLQTPVDTGEGIRVAINPGERVNRDFILRYALGDDSVTSAVTYCPDTDADGREKNEGTFSVTLVPPVDLSKNQRPRSVVFVLDRSGSMGGWKMVAARRAMARMVDTLTDRDQFTVYAFDNNIETPASFLGKGLQPASDRNRFRAVEFLAQVDARGGTEMAGPLDAGVKVLNESGDELDKILVLVTDGQVGNEDQILKRLGKKVDDIRVFTLGIDRSVNAAFLNRLAQMGGGISELVESEDRLDEVMDKVHRLIGTPVLTDVKISANNGTKIDPDSIVPRRLPDLFTGQPVLITGRYQGHPEGAITVKARRNGGGRHKEVLPGRVTHNSALASIWARGQIRELEDLYVQGRGDTVQLEKRIVEISIGFKVLCRFTAFVAIDRSEVVNKGGENLQVTQPVDAPDGWDMLGTDAVAQHEVMRSTAAGPPMQPAAPPPASKGGLLNRLGLGGGGKTAKPKRSEERRRDQKNAEVSAPASAPPETVDLGDAGAAPDAVGSLDVNEDELATPLSAEPLTTTQAGMLSPAATLAADMLKEIQEASKAPEGELLARLTDLADDLDDLIKDLKNDGTPERIVLAFADLLSDIREVLATQTQVTEEVRLIWARAEKVLHAFLSGSTPPERSKKGKGNKRRRSGFWK